MSAPVFIACRRAISSVESGAAAVSAAMSSIWPPTMPARPAARARPAQSAARISALGVGARIGEDLEGERLQRVAGEDGGRLVEGAVGGRPAAPQVVVVHRRQIVVDQRIGVQALDRGAGAEAARASARPSARAVSIDQEGPQPLAAAERRIAHGLEEPPRARRLARPRLERRAARRARASTAAAAAASRALNARQSIDV